jgi:hypothetical protein
VTAIAAAVTAALAAPSPVARAQPGAPIDPAKADDAVPIATDDDAADDADSDSDSDDAKDKDPPDQSLAAVLGTAAGGRTTPGGARVGGRYLYRLSSNDWFEGHVAFTFGAGSAECFRDRSDAMVCDHGVADGFGGELGAGIRRRFPVGGLYQPFVRAAAAARIVRFGADDVLGFAIPLIGAGGVRAQVADTVAVTAEASLELGVGFFNHDLGTEPQAGFAIALMAELEL